MFNDDSWRFNNGLVMFSDDFMLTAIDGFYRKLRLWLGNHLDSGDFPASHVWWPNGKRGWF